MQEVPGSIPGTALLQNVELQSQKRCKISWIEGFRAAVPAHFDLDVITGDVAQMVERSLSMREVRGSIPRISIFSQTYGMFEKPQLVG